MSTFIATMVYELHSATDPDARKLLRAELVGRRWYDRQEGVPLPSNALWIRRDAPSEHTTDDVHRACTEDLFRAVAAVSAMGRKIALLRAWVQVSGAGSYGLVELPKPPA